jgi:hypothetical protein
VKPAENCKNDDHVVFKTIYPGVQVTCHGDDVGFYEARKSGNLNITYFKNGTSSSKSYDMKWYKGSCSDNGYGNKTIYSYSGSGNNKRDKK